MTDTEHRVEALERIARIAGDTGLGDLEAGRQIRGVLLEFQWPFALSGGTRWGSRGELAQRPGTRPHPTPWVDR